MMVELLAAGLTGGNFSFEFDWSKHPGARTPWTGQLLIVIDPDKGSGQHFALRSEELVRQLHGAGQERLPGTDATASVRGRWRTVSTSLRLIWSACRVWRAVEPFTNSLTIRRSQSCVGARF